MYTGIPSDLIFDDEPLDGLLYGSGGAEPSPADALAACEGRDELPAEWRKAVVAILVRDPEKGRGLVAETLSRIVDQEAKALEGTDADQPRDLLRLARLWCAVQRNDEAEAAYRRALAVLDGPEALSPDERLLATGQLAELLDAVGRSPEAQEQRALGEAERLLANPDTGALIAVRSTALRLFLAGRYDAAAQLYRRLLERHFQKAGTWVHLARVLLMQDRIAEARQAVANACKSARRPAGPEAVPPYVWPRTLFLRLAFAMLRRRPNAHLVWKLKSALRASPEQEPWTIAPVVDCIRSALLPTDSELLIAFAEAINDADKLDALDGLSNAVIADANPPCAARDDSPAC